MADSDDDKFDIDLGKLENRLQKAEEVDVRYWLQNDAKLRAVQQFCTYDEFKELVNTSHLSPLNGGDQIQKMSADRSSGWNSTVNGKVIVNVPQVDSQSDKSDNPSSSLPRNYQEFSRRWRSDGPSEKRLILLKLLGGQRLSDLFQAELSSNLFSEIAAVLTERQSDDEKHESALLLSSVVLTRGFQRGLCSHFLSPDIKNRLRCLLNQCKDNDSMDIDVEKLSQALQL